MALYLGENQVGGSVGTDIETLLNRGAYCGTTDSAINPPTFTADDSDKLGGQLPSYYLQNDNILDNAYFANPINQRELSSTDSSGTQYIIDRWLSVSATYLNNTITANDMEQRIEPYKITGGKNYTIQICFDDDTILSGSNIAPSSEIDYSKTLLTSETKNIEVFLKYTPTRWRLELHALNVTGTFSVKWVKLEEGTIATKFIPKIYSLELLNCMYYYQVVKWVATKGSVTDQYATGTKFVIPMRIVPTLSSYNDDRGNTSYISINNGAKSNQIISLLTLDKNGFAFAISSTVIAAGANINAILMFSADL